MSKKTKKLRDAVASELHHIQWLLEETGGRNYAFVAEAKGRARSLHSLVKNGLLDSLLSSNKGDKT